MAITVTPADGFISRLLQQTHQAASNRNTASTSQQQSSPARQDQASISDEARQATQQNGNHQLESKLMDLYNQRGSNTR